MAEPVTAKDVARMRRKRWYFSVRVEAGHRIHLRLTHASAIEFTMRATGAGTRVLMERCDGETDIHLRLD